MLRIGRVVMLPARRALQGENRAFLVALMLAGSAIATSFDTRADGQPAPRKELPVYRRKEVEAKTSLDKGGVWVTYKNGVYDVTKFLSNHPGGQDKLMLAAGKDLTTLWKLGPYQQHFRSPLAFELLEEMKVGQVHPDDVVLLDSSQLEREPLAYSDRHIYDCIVVGSGLSGLQTAKALQKDHHVVTENILVLEAQDYVGGRVRQMTDFVKGVKVDVGAEFLHGNNTNLTRFAEEQKEPTRELYCWAHGDGGPLPAPVDKGYGLYWLNDGKGRKRLLRYDDKDGDFVAMNEALWEISELNESEYNDSHSLYDFLHSRGFSDEMMMMAAGGFANTLCTNPKDLSLKQCIRWTRLWHGDGGEDGDFEFEKSYSCLVDFLKDDVQVETGCPVTEIHLPESDAMGGLVMLKTGGTNGATYFARSVVVTSSPHVLKSGLVKFHPPLSAEFNEALETTNMHNIVKVFLKFSEPVWPDHLHGMIMTDPNMLLPEIWFRNVAAKADKDEPAKAYAVAFTTADYAARVAALPKEEVLRRSVAQLDEIFSHLLPRHMDAELGPQTKQPAQLKKPSEAYLGGMFWDWNPSHHPYIGGGYCSPKANTPAHKIAIMAQPYGKLGNVFFAGEATNLPGATAHAALESGVRAAGFVSQFLKRAAADQDGAGK